MEVVTAVVSPVVHGPEYAAFEFRLARDLSMTRARMRRMCNAEYMGWMAFYMQEAKAQKAALEEARKGRK